MFTRKQTEKTGLEKAIDEILAEMANEEGHTERYAQLVKQLSKLMKMQTQARSQRVSPDTWVIAGANLAGIALIVGHERAHVVTSKAIGFIQKLR